MTTRSPLISFPVSYHCNHSLYTGIFFDHLKISVIKPLYKKGDRTSVANLVNQSGNYFIHPLSPVFDIGHISKVIGLKLMYGKTCLFCHNQFLA